MEFYCYMCVCAGGRVLVEMCGVLLLYVCLCWWSCVGRDVWSSIVICVFVLVVVCW